MRLDGRTALVTGGTQGVGAAVAQALASAGCDLIVHGLQEDAECRQTLDKLAATGVKVHPLFFDLASPAETWLDELMGRVESTGEDVSILINNAGTCCDRPFLEMSYELFERTMRLNVTAGYFLTQAFARLWVKNGVAGRVLFTGSINGELAEVDHTAYDTSKGAVRTMVRSLCVALAPHGIRVNAMAPGLVVTPLTSPILVGDTETTEWMKLHTPNGQVPGPQVCGSAALFLVSDEAEHVHGQTLLVDGGMSVWQQPDLPDHLRGKLATQERPIDR